MKWKTTIVSASKIGDDGDAVVMAWTVLTFENRKDFLSNFPGFDLLLDTAGVSIDRLTERNRWVDRISFLPSDNFDYVLAGPEDERTSWGRLIIKTPIEVNADTQEQVDALIGQSDEDEDGESYPPF